MYGVNCSEDCGACVNNEACHHINGSCLTGCDKGYYGQKCDQGNASILVCKKKMYYQGNFVSKTLDIEMIALKFDILLHRQNWGLFKIIFNYWYKFSCNLNLYELLKILFALTECSAGYYGHNCEEPCSLTCKDQGLSLIHIWRCRRYAVCRSRWSPYH